MKKYLLGGKGNFYKANLHCHTVVSDGRLTAKEVKDLYKSAGYSVLAFTDHGVIVPHTELTDENFVAITAYEASVNAPRPDYLLDNLEYLKTYHLNFYAKDPSCDWSPCFHEKCLWLEHMKNYVSPNQKKISFPIEYSVKCVNDMLNKAKEFGFLVCFNHPVWSEQSYPDYIDLKGLWGIETYNHGSAIEGYVDTDAPFDNLLKKGNCIVPIASDDMHKSYEAFGGFSMIESENLDYRSVFRAMEEKRLYSSTGPLIQELSIDGNELTVRCSEAVAIYLNSERRWEKVAFGDGITEAVFDISGWMKGNVLTTYNKTKVDEPFLRLTIVDKQGKKAWTRGYFKSDL